MLKQVARQLHLESRRRHCQKIHHEEDEHSPQRGLERYHIHIWGSRDAISSHGRNAEFDKYSNIPDYVMCFGGHYFRENFTSSRNSLWNKDGV